MSPLYLDYLLSLLRSMLSESSYTADGITSVSQSFKHRPQARRFRSHFPTMAPAKDRISDDTRGQTTKKAKRGSTLRFVNVAVTRSKAHFPLRDPQEDRFIRAHVMNDYLQQKLKSSEPRNVSSDVPKLSDHLIRFRLHSEGKKRRSGRRDEEVISDERTSALTKMRAIVPKEDQTLRDVVSARSLVSSILCNFPSPISSTPGTSTLLEYYHHSFWENSLAVNPEGMWMSVAISDPAVFHATLCLVALHKSQTRGGLQASSYFWHRGEAMRLISQNLADPAQATSDATIGAVAILSTADNCVSLSVWRDRESGI